MASIRRFCCWQDDSELLAAVPISDIHSSQLVNNRMCNFAQHIVARLMPVGVVELLEVVDVEQQQREWNVLALPDQGLLYQLLLKRAPIGKRCQRVCACLRFACA